MTFVIRILWILAGFVLLIVCHAGVKPALIINRLIPAIRNINKFFPKIRITELLDWGEERILLVMKY